MPCGGFKEAFVSSILNTSGVLALVDSQLEVVKLGRSLHVFHPIYRDCFGSESIIIKVSIEVLYLPYIGLCVCAVSHALLCDVSSC
jgi:hypothetical protein